MYNATMHKTKSGFTLVELLIVIVVIALLAAIAIVAYNGIQVRARDTQRKQDIAQIEKALELFYIEHGHFPTSHNGGSLINNGWSTSVEPGVWQTFADQLSSVSGELPTDPKNTHTNGVHSSTHDNEYHYAYYATDGSSGYQPCGKNNTDHNQSRLEPQMYLLVYKLEGNSQVNRFRGDCPPVTLQYNHASNVRVVK